MNHKDLKVNRIGPILIPDRTRVLLRPFFPLSKEIARRMISSVMALSEDKVSTILEQVLQDFSQRHEFVEPFFTKRADQILDMLGELPAMSRKQRLLAGAYFSHEYSPESTALFNPSIVKHPNQSGLPTGSLRFILSLRATGEHHISSITFRTGTLNARHRITMTPPVPFIAEPEPMVNASYQKDLFSRKGYDIENLISIIERILGIDRINKVILVGHGKVGEMLTSNTEVLGKSFNIVEVFDKSPSKVGKEIKDLNIKIKDIKDIDSDLGKINVDTAILSVIKEQAQIVTDILVKNHVKGILNFTTYKLETPDDVAVVDVNISANLQELNFWKDMLKNKGE